MNQKKVLARQPVTQLDEDAKPKKASGIGAVATGMVKFMKRTEQAEPNEIK